MKINKMWLYIGPSAVMFILGLILFILGGGSGKKTINDVYCVDKNGDTVATYQTTWPIKIGSKEKCVRFVSIDGEDVVLYTETGQIIVKPHSEDDGDNSE